MKALVVPEAGALEIQDIPDPEIGPYDALVRIEVCGICNSTDDKLIAGKMFWAPPFPFVLGHESVGTVVQVGSKVRKYEIGDLVTRPVAFWPGSRQALNVAKGGFAELGMVRDGAAMAADGDTSLADDYDAQRQLVVPKGLDPRDAALAISLSETASVLKHLPNLRGKRVVVAGTGVTGLAFTLWVKLAGGFVITLGRRAERLRKAAKLGADVTINTGNQNYLDEIREAGSGSIDGLIEATGDTELAEHLLAVLQPRGFASAYGVPPVGTQYHPRWETAVVEEHLSFAWVADLIERGWVQTNWFISHAWEFDDVLTAFSQAKRGEVTKGFVRIT